MKGAHTCKGRRDRQPNIYRTGKQIPEFRSKANAA